MVVQTGLCQSLSERTFFLPHGSFYLYFAFQELLHQKEQLNNIEGKTTKINTDLKTSQKHLTNIKSIFGGIKNWWAGDKDKDASSKPGDPRAGTSSKLQETVEKNQASRPHPGERLRTDDGRGFYEDDEEDLDSRFMQGAKGQNQYFKPVTKSRKEEMMNENLGNYLVGVGFDCQVSAVA